MIAVSSLTFMFKHVKGHQIDHFGYLQLDWLDQHNNNMNKEAKFLNKCTHVLFLQHHYQSPLFCIKIGPYCCTEKNLLLLKYSSWYDKGYPVEESKMTRKCMQLGSHRIGTKLLRNACGLSKTLFQCKHQVS